MPNVKFLVRRAMGMDWKQMYATAKALSAPDKAGRSVPWLFQDMLQSAVKYGAGYMDYKIAEMYRLSDAQRRTVITRAVSNSIVARMNDKADWHFFDNKDEFNTLFARYLRRDWLDVRKTDAAGLAAWLEGRGPVIGKPMDGSSGRGVEKFTPDDWVNVPAFFETLKAKGLGLLEDCVVQHPDMAALCPTSVNTIRIATLLGDKRQGIVYAYLRIGNGKVMDNVDCGGMAAPVDLETGKLSSVGADKKGNRYEKHPMTGTTIPGFRIPHWEEAKRMALEAAQVKPRVRFVAWDVAVTAEGPVFIEGNSFPSHAIPQFAAHFPDGIGILPRFREFIDV